MSDLFEKDTMTNVYCTAPWNGLTVKEDGIVRTCCSGRTALGDLNTTPINDILSNRNIIEIKQSLLSSKSHDNCADCEQSEVSGYSSLRQYYLKHYNNIEENNLGVLDIRWNNTCNLSCVYCGPNLSSKWAKKIGITNISSKREYSDELVNFIIDKADTVREIMLVGGEPLMMKYNHILFDKLPINTQISIITNLTVDLESAPFIGDLLKRPANKIIWNVSLENTHECFEYIRNGGTWKQIEKNLIFLNRHWPNSIAFSMVYHVFSALQIDKTVNVLLQHVNPKITLLNVMGVEHIDIFKMPSKIQELAKEKLLLAIRALGNHYGEDAHLYPITNSDHALSVLGDPKKQVTLESFERCLDYLDRHHTQKCRIIFEDEYKRIKSCL